jgi:hypothetical protein
VFFAILWLPGFFPGKNIFIWEAIGEVFPSLATEIFYNNETSGTLYYKYIKLRRDMSLSKLISVRKYNRHPNLEDATEQPEGEIDCTVSASASFQWLKVNVDPWRDVAKHWRASMALRRGFLEECGSTEEFLQTFPCLQNSAALTLVSYWNVFYR